MKLFLIHGTGDRKTLAEEKEACAECKDIPCEKHANAQQKWWEARGPFVKEIASAAKVNIEPVEIKWSGANLESARAEGSDILDNKIQKAEKAKEEYVIVAHSHGGNVAYSTLANRALHNERLRGLKAWYTIGTPFIHNYAAEKFLSGRFSKRAFFVSFLLLYGLIFVPLTYKWVSNNLDNPGWTALIAVIGFFAIFLIGQLALFPNTVIRGKNTFYNNRRWRLAPVLDRWVGVIHDEDEAFIGLEAAESGKLDLFQKGFGTPFIRGLFVGLFALIMLAAAIVAAAERFPSYTETDATGDTEEIVELARGVPGAEAIATIWVWIEDRLLSIISSFGVPDFASFLIVYAVAALVLWRALLISTPIIDWLSIFYTKAFDRIVRASVSRQAFGNDEPDITHQYVYLSPDVSKKVWGLPDNISADLENYASEHASKTLTQIRRTLGLGERGARSIEVARFLKDFITWDELIHTSYFKVPSSRSFLVEDIADTIDNGVKQEEAKSDQEQDEQTPT